nr:hypothetical protein [Tanacetum cinerariifolium]
DGGGGVLISEAGMGRESEE